MDGTNLGKTPLCDVLLFGAVQCLSQWRIPRSHGSLQIGVDSFARIAKWDLRPVSRDTVRHQKLLLALVNANNQNQSNTDTRVSAAMSPKSLQNFSGLIYL